MPSSRDVFYVDPTFQPLIREIGLDAEAIFTDPRVKLFHKVSISTGGRLSDFSIRYHYRNQIFFARKFLGAFWPAYTALLEFGAGMLAVLRSGETPRHLLLRMKALGEGLTMPCERA